ncbi:hypothetical protein CR513_38358, partial [Mucuna pruriens]
MVEAIYRRGPWSLQVFPCRADKPVCKEPTDDREPFFYLYDTLSFKLGIRLPFTKSERAILHALNIAPTQLHPNYWAFIRAFELLSEDMQ